MTKGRGPDYADELTAPEREVLAKLVARVEHGDRYERSGRASRRAPVAAGLAGLVILLAATVAAGQLAGPSRSSNAPQSGGGTAVTVFENLAAAAAASPPAAAAAGDTAHQRRLDVVVASGDDPPDHCRVTTLTIDIWKVVEDIPHGRDAPERAEPPYARLEVERTQPPPAALAGCATTTLTEGPVTVPFEGELLAGWERLASKLGPDAPRYTPMLFVELDPASTAAPSPLLADLMAGNDPPHEWWSRLVRLLASPQPEPGTAAVALEAAARRAAEASSGTVELLGRGADITGRPGISLRVPYALDDRAASAEITLDPDTGALLQLLVDTRTGTEITAYRTIRWSASPIDE